MTSPSDPTTTYPIQPAPPQPVYPQPSGAPDYPAVAQVPPAKKPRKGLLIGAVVVVGVLCIGTIAVNAAGGSDDKGKLTQATTTKTQATSAATTSPAAAKTTAAAAPIGDKAQTFTGHSDKLIKLKGLSKDRLHVARMTYR